MKILQSSKSNKNKTQFCYATNDTFSTLESATYRCSSKQFFFENIAIVTVKHLCWNLNLFKKRLQHRYFLGNNANILRTAFHRTPLVTASKVFKSLEGSNTGVFLWILRNCSEQLFYRTPPVVVSGVSYTVSHLHDVSLYLCMQYRENCCKTINNMKMLRNPRRYTLFYKINSIRTFVVETQPKIGTA